MRVLLVGPDPAAVHAISGALEQHGFDVVVVPAGEAAAAHVEPEDVDVAVVDHRSLEAPEVAQLRARAPHLYVIAVWSAPRKHGADEPLPVGVDDFVQHPASPDELALRVQLAGRRRTSRGAGPLDVGPLRLDGAARVATVGRRAVDLTRLEFDLLWHLVTHPGRTFDRAELLRAVWASSAEWQTPATVTEHVRRLRRKLEAAPGVADRIVTVRGVGYRFEVGAEVDVGAAPGPGAFARPATTTATQDAIVVVVDSDRIVAASAAALELLGAASDEDLVGRSVLEFVAERSVGAIRARRLCVRAGRVPHPEVITALRVDGGERDLLMASTQVLWDGAVASQITLWDPEAERSRLRQATSWYEDDEPAVVVTDTQLRIQSFNTTAEALYGWREAEVIGRNGMEVMPWIRDDQLASSVEEALIQDGYWEGEVVQERRDGSRLTAVASVAMLIADDGQFIGFVTVNRPVA